MAIVISRGELFVMFTLASFRSEMRKTLPFVYSADSTKATGQTPHQSVWLGMHAGQALPSGQAGRADFRKDPISTAGRLPISSHLDSAEVYPANEPMCLWLQINNTAIPYDVAETLRHYTKIRPDTVGRVRATPLFSPYRMITKIWASKFDDFGGVVRSGRTGRRRFRARCYHGRHG